MGPPELDEDHVRLAHYAHKYRQRLAATIVPYWYEVSRDDFGGYLLVDDLRQSRWRRTGRGRPRIRTERKQLVTQARLVWTFSHAHRKGLVDGAHDYLAAADQGYRFLLEHFLDDEKGGYRWMTDRRGRAVNDIKVLYGQAFVIYAFVEYARAGGDPSALQHALDVHGAVHDHLHDDVHGGWFEHAEPDWRPLLAGDHRGLVEIIGLKSANAHLHWFEALTELSATTGHAGVRESLTEAYRVSRRYFYPAEPGRSCQHRSPDWSPVTTAQSACLSYGHSIQFAWLMIHAERALGVGLSWDYFFAHLEHALRYGFDHCRGGVYRSGFDDQPATNTDKVWWAQAEMIAALTDGLQHRWDPRHAAALARLLDFVERHQTDRADGIWLEEVTARGRRRVARTVGPWKDGYHDVRALVKFVEAFASIDGGRSAV